jgi:predicted dinucleotide-binding enzyme
MATAIIGVGSIGKAVATNLVAGGEDVLLAARTQAKAELLAEQLGGSASATSVTQAVGQADTVLFAVWLDATKELIQQFGPALDGKVVIDPSNPVAAGADGQFSRTLPEGVSGASVIAGLLPPESHLAKAFGTLGADALADGANRSPERAVLFYATNDDTADSVVRRLIAASGFDAVKIGGLDQAIRIEMFGDLHQFGGLNGKLLSLDEAKAVIG